MGISSLKQAYPSVSGERIMALPRKGLLMPLRLISSTLRESYTIRDSGAKGRTDANAIEKARNDVLQPSEMEVARIWEEGKEGLYASDNELKN